MADISKVNLPNDNNNPYDLKDTKARGITCTMAQYLAWEQAGTIDPNTTYFVSDGVSPAITHLGFYLDEDGGLCQVDSM